jgi:hypothetical protein
VRKLKAALIFLGAVTLSARAGWIETTFKSEDSPVRGLIHEHVQVENSTSGESATLEVAVFPSNAFRFRVIDNPEGGENLSEAMAAGGCLAGVNGGYFDPAFIPIGLRVMDGKIVQPLVRARLLTGVLFCSRDSVQVVRIREYSSNRHPTAGVQCGPLLVDGHRPVRGLDTARSARRTFAAVSSNRAAFGFCQDVSLADLAEILSQEKFGGDFVIDRALNLDGGSSSAFWFRRAAGAFSISEQKSVRDFVGIVPK